MSGNEWEQGRLEAVWEHVGVPLGAAAREVPTR